MHIVFSYQTQHNNISILLYFTWYQSPDHKYPKLIIKIKINPPTGYKGRD